MHITVQLKIFISTIHVADHDIYMRALSHRIIRPAFLLAFGQAFRILTRLRIRLDGQVSVISK